jgi:hypothetical protein
VQRVLRYRDTRYPDELRTVHQLRRVSRDPEESGFGTSEVSSTRKSCLTESRSVISRQDLNCSFGVRVPGDPEASGFGISGVVKMRYTDPVKS